MGRRDIILGWDFPRALISDAHRTGRNSLVCIVPAKGSKQHPDPVFRVGKD